MLGEGFYSGFGGVVGRVGGGVRDSLFGACDDDGGGVGLGAEGGEEGGYAVDDAEEVGVHDLYTEELISIDRLVDWNVLGGKGHFVEVFNILPPAFETDACV